MAGKIGVYFDLQNIGGGLDVEALAAQLREKWGDLTPVVKVCPVLAESVDEIQADIEAQGLDGVLLCGASPRVDAGLYRFPVQVEHVNLREQCVLAFKNPAGNPEGTDDGAPELLTLMARDYLNMGVIRLQKSEVPDSAAIAGTPRILVIGGGWTGLTAAAEAAATGYEVVLVEKASMLGGAANNIPVASPLGPLWTDKQPTDLAAKISRVTDDPQNHRASERAHGKAGGPARRIYGRYRHKRRFGVSGSGLRWSWPRAGCPWMKIPRAHGARQSPRWCTRPSSAKCWLPGK